LRGSSWNSRLGYLGVRQEEPVINLSASIAIPRPREEVFAFISDVANMPKWVTGVVSAKLDTAEMEVGSTFTLQYRPNWRADSVVLQVVDFESPARLATRSSKGPFHFEGTVTLSEVEGATTVTNTIEAGPDSLSTKLATLLLGPLLVRSMRKRLLKELIALERAIVA
jgi:uncharacterized protein YndB with AHSA1/START domain